jgi:glycyl-tRNA synthetase beta chain
MPELLLEIGCEEIPARFVPDALDQLGRNAKAIFDRERVAFKAIKTYGTPRRLVLVVDELSELQAQKKMEKWGPNVAQAYDMNGNATKAALGFAKSVGAPLEKIQKKDSDKGQRLYYSSEQGGNPTKDLLKTLLPELILGIKLPKSMRWGYGEVRFARPIHWIVALFNGEVVGFEIAGIKSGSKTFGHRFLAPGAIEVKDFGQYLESLKKAFVIVDPEERKRLIERQLAEKSQQLGVEIYPDPELIEEVNFLVEYPVVLCGEFSKRFLEVPAEVLIAAMRGHQRYFALKEKGQGIKLANNFLFVANIKTADDNVVIKGNQKVLSARLTDAEFFYREDLKTPLIERAEKLKQMVFQAKLGTYHDKAVRMEKLIAELAEKAAPGDQQFLEQAVRAVKLCKADLVTQMVGEFPELEGIMAGEYARAQKEPAPVWRAIHEHYLPKTASDIEQGRLPETLLGKILSVSDKIDSIIAGFVAGNQPTGSQDPYGIRRMANGVCCIALKSRLEFNLDKLVESGASQFAGAAKVDAGKIQKDVTEFFRSRLKNIFMDEKIEYDIANAVIAAWDGGIISAWDRAAALSELRKEPGFDDLFVGFRRVARIIEDTGELDQSLFAQKEEKGLWEAFLGVKEEVEVLIRDKKWKDAMRSLGKLKPDIDKFFDEVMVNVEDLKLRKNRHTLLEHIAREFRAIADFSQLVGADKNSESQGGL